MTQSERVMQAFCDVLLRLPGVDLEHKADVPYFRADENEPKRVIRMLNGVETSGYFLGGHFVTGIEGPTIFLKETPGLCETPTHGLVGRMDRWGVFSIDDVLSARTAPGTVSTTLFELEDGSQHEIRMSSKRYHTFARHLACYQCGLVGKFFALDRNAKRNRQTGEWESAPACAWSFNLYGVRDDGVEVMMTKDHLLPKSKGGSDELSNLHTMCSPCNGRKGDKIIK